MAHTTTLSPSSPPSEFRRGWKPLLTAFLTFGSGPIIFLQTNALFVEPIRAETGLSATQVQTGSIVNLLVAIAGVGVGFLVNKHGARRLVITGFSLMGVLALLLAFLPATVFTLYSIAALLGITGALCYHVPYTRFISSWFQKSFGLAMGTMSAGASVTPLIMTPLIVWTIYEFGWRWGYVTIAALVLVIALPMVILGFRENETEIPSVVKTTAASSDKTPAGVSIKATSRDTLRNLRDPRLLLVLIGCAIATFAIGGIMSSVQPFMIELGRPVETATAMSMALLVGIITGRIVGGSLLDKVWPYAVPLVVCSISGVTAVILSQTAATAAVALVVFMVFLLGFGQGADADFPAFFTLKLTSRIAFPAIFGIIGLATGLSTTVGALIAASIKDATGSYTMAFVMSGIAYLIAGMLLFANGLLGRAMAAKGKHGSDSTTTQLEQDPIHDPQREPLKVTE
ncbi:major facilitator superfamily protein [Corynebacterium suranareeae]|uniref:Major facilitator superfamily protein n=1 Tax=Corynebacterium suranareeae TaxID=2506452 RepID=A0A161J7V4_9CORY|nr:MFS transporter [Corynebacterium suranareeae]BAU94422.1 major facilitator superfamily protein [Corynebacterium suranareeae]